MMPFHLAEIQEEDCTAFALLDEAASANWPLARAMEQGKASRQEMFEQWFKSIFGKDASARWMKAVDSETGEMAAGALWRMIEPSTSQKKEEAAEKAAKASVGEDEETPPVFIEMGRRWKEFQDEFVGDQPFANLQVLVAHPKYQRQGAGSMLVKYGCDLADVKGVPCALTASEAGYPLYLRHGFELKQTSEMDLRPFGVEGVEVRRGMVRPAKRRE